MNNQDSRSGRRRHGLTVLELLVSMSLVVVLAGLALPALSAVRESARRIQCVEHLRQVGLALHHHHSATNRLPTGWAFDPSNRSAFGWCVPLLPHLEQGAVAARVNHWLPLEHPSNGIARQTVLEVMRCPSDIAQPFFQLFEEQDEKVSLGLGGIAVSRDDAGPAALYDLPVANYVGVFGTLDPDISVPAPLGDGAFLENRVTRFGDFQRGLSQTLVVGERTMAKVPSTWLGVSLIGEDAAARLVGAALQGINNPLADECDFSSRHPGGANFLWGDGHVSFVTAQIDLALYHQSARLRR